MWENKKTKKLCIGRLLKRFLHDKDGDVHTIELSCLKPKVGLGTIMEETPDHGNFYSHFFSDTQNPDNRPFKRKVFDNKNSIDQSLKNLIKEMNSLPDAPIFFVCFVAKRDFHWQQQFDSKGHNLNKYTSSTLSLCLIFCCILLFIVACYIYLFAVIIIQLYLL